MTKIDNGQIDYSERNKMIKTGIRDYAQKTLEMEKSRQDILFSKSQANVTSISVLLVALFTIIFEFLDRLKCVQNLIIIFSFILTFLLLLSLFFSIKSQWMMKNKYTRRASELIEHINHHLDEYSNEEAFLDQNIRDIEDIHETLESNNDKRVIDLMISSICLYVFFALIIIFSIVLLIIVV